MKDYARPLGPGLAEAEHVMRTNIGNIAVTGHGIKKNETLYRLAREARGGAIVETGCYLGAGIIALGAGTRDGHYCPIYAVDDYTEKGGWIYGEHYEPSDLTKFWINMGAASLHPTLVQKDMRFAAAEWAGGPVALWVWDIARFDRIQADFDAWERHIMPGGVVALRDIDDFRFGAKDVCARSVATGAWGDFREWPGFIVSIERL